MDSTAQFEHWAEVTDAYAKMFLLLQRGDNSARPELRRLGLELQHISESIGGATPVRPASPAITSRRSLGALLLGRLRGAWAAKRTKRTAVALSVIGGLVLVAMSQTVASSPVASCARPAHIEAR